MAQAVTDVRTRSRKEWADLINADWRKSIEGIIRTGQRLAEAKRELPHGEFGRMVTDDLLFSERTARQLMRISAHPSITNRTPASGLPNSWAVLSELAKLSPNDFTDAQARGLINGQTSKRAARAIIGAYDAPVGAATGGRSKRDMLPSPSEANQIAKETGRLVTASDGRLYTGATDEEAGDAVRRRQQTFGVRDAIDKIAACPVSARTWVSEAEDFWLHGFTLGSVDAAIEWLTKLRPALAKKQKVLDAE